MTGTVGAGSWLASSVRIAAVIDGERLAPWQAVMLGRVPPDLGQVVAILAIDSGLNPRRFVRGAGRGATAVAVADYGAMWRHIESSGCRVVVDLTGRGLDPDGAPAGVAVWRLVTRWSPSNHYLVEVALLACLDGAVSTLAYGVVRAAAHSPRRTRQIIHRSVAGWLVRALRTKCTPEHAGPPWDGGTDVLARTTVSWAARSAWALARRVLDAVVHRESWHVGIVDAPVATILRERRLGPVRWLDEAPRRLYLADPFALEGTDAILAEAFDHITGRGRIVAIEGVGRGTSYSLRDVLATTGHLSYPYLLQADGRRYCIPEQSDTGSVVVLEAVNYPAEWRRAATIVSGMRAVDPTLVRQDDRWWLFCTDERDGTESNLYVFYADELLGPWRPHERNPVKVDVRSARPAGPLVTLDGELYRPAQDGTDGYGSAVTINRITQLTPEHFGEEPVARLEPDRTGPYGHGVHTITAWGDVTLIDGKRKSMSLLSLGGRVRSVVMGR